MFPVFLRRIIPPHVSFLSSLFCVLFQDPSGVRHRQLDWILIGRQEVLDTTQCADKTTHKTNTSAIWINRVKKSTNKSHS